ncbi:MAG: hypothetical protein ACREF4_19050 [Gammaproteobacteria bacterium]
MTGPAFQELRRVAAAVAKLRGEAVRDATVRSDLRGVRLEFESGLILLVALERDEEGRARLEIDVVTPPQETVAKQQIEVRFD